MTVTVTRTRTNPFLRWAGGKRWLIHRLEPLLAGLSFKNYHEPFLGGASVFLGLDPKGRSFLSDLNVELIETYEAVKCQPNAVAEVLAQHENRQQHYYEVRDQNPTDPIERAARFIYLNHTSFNGIYRVNLDGRYNVPYGNRESPKYPTAEDLTVVSGRLQSATLLAQDFKKSVKRVREGDLVFLDPPYTVAHNDNGFVKYNQKLFSFGDQQALRDAIDLIKQRSAFYILTNAAHQSIADLFDSEDQKLVVSRRNNVGGKKATRGSATEFLYTNLPAA